MKKILLIDDNKEFLGIVAHIIKSHGFQVRTYQSGYDVVDVVKNYNPDLILLDVRFGDQYGTDICKELKKSYNIPIILLTADTAKGNAFADCDADGFIEKPFEIAELITSIRTFLKKTEKYSDTV